MEITFIRHSRTKIDPQVPIARWGLSDEGIRLAQELSTHSVIKRTEVLYTSLQTKALETAIFLAKPNGIPIKANDNLTEVTSLTGLFEADFEKYEQNVKDYYLGILDRINGGETQQEAVARFTQAMELIVDAERDKDNIGIVSHGNILTLYSSQFRDIDCYATHTKIKRPDIAIFDWEKKEFIHFFGEII